MDPAEGSYGLRPREVERGWLAGVPNREKLSEDEVGRSADHRPHCGDPSERATVRRPTTAGTATGTIDAP
jgi:hypothetical protein